MTKRSLTAVIAVGATALSLAACSGGSAGHAGSTDKFMMTIPSDPGALDPMHSAQGVTQTVLRFAYDSLVSFTPQGTPEPYLAASWQIRPKQVVFTLKKGITCSDGTPFTATDGATTFNYAADPKRQSDYLRDLPTGLTATADDAAGTVTVTSAEPDSFLIYKTGGIFMQCAKGLQDPASLQHATDGTGLFTLTASVPGDSYTFTRRDGYTWGPEGVTSSTPDLPKTATVKVVKNESTAANLFISNAANLVTIIGPDRARTAAAASVTRNVPTALGLMFFNEAAGHPTSDPEVRRALTTALDRATVGKVMSNGDGVTPESLVTVPPNPCNAKTVPGNLPDYDTAAAASLLDAAGWPTGPDGIRVKNGKRLALTFIYNSALGESVSAAAELLATEWHKIGVEVKLNGLPPEQLGPVVYGTGAWDAGWLPITVGIPSDFVARVSGPTPPKGSNFAWISNKTYVQEATAASALPLPQACAHWSAAEVALLKNFDVVPVVDGTIPYFGRGVTFEVTGGLPDPTTIRMTGKGK